VPSLPRNLLPILVAAVALAMSMAGIAVAAGRHTDHLLAPTAACPGSSRIDTTVPEQVGQMACLVQYARAQAGRASLRETVTLDGAAASKIETILHCRQFTHTPCAQPFERVFGAAGYPLAVPLTIGENLAWGYGPLESPRQVMQVWLDSPEHRENLLSARWTSFGLGVRTGKTFLGYPDATLWATEFSSR
jgi:uncharacterized protein YkwD